MTDASTTPPMREQWVDVDEMKIHVTEVGDGDPIVMLHGGGVGASALSNFRTNLPALSRRFRLVLVDQPGFGASSKSVPEHESYWRVAARCVREVLVSLGIPKAHLLGNSLGGGTSLRFALEYPDMVDRLVLMGPAGGSVKILSPGEIVSDVDRVVRRFYDEPSFDRMRDFVDQMVFDPASVPDSLIEERLQVAMDPDAMAFMGRLFASLGSDPDADLWKEVDRVTHPTLLLWGREDRVLPFDSALLMFHRMRDVRLVALARCGHWVQTEKQEEFDRIVADFLLPDEDASVDAR